jgi:Flp pilus assembly pilin Flp
LVVGGGELGGMEPSIWDERGQGLVEYGLLLFFMVLMGFIGVITYRGSLGDFLGSVVSRVSGAL